MLTYTLMSILSFFLVVVLIIGIFKYVKLDQIRMLNVATLSLFFPITIPFSGKDAMTTGGIMILVVYLSYLISTVKAGEKVIKRHDWLVYLLILFGAVANKMAIDEGYVVGEDIGPIIRQYFSFATSLLIFITIKNSVSRSESYGPYGASEVTEKLITMILVLTAIHVVISVTNRYIPATNALVAVFYAKDADALLPEGQSRITSFVFSYENYGEILAALCPLVVYKIVATRKLVWFFCLAIFACGVLLSVTRSGIMLFAFALIVSFMYQFRKEVGKAVAFLAFLFAAVGGIVTVDSTLSSDLFSRFSLAEDSYSTGGSVFDTINRGNFPDIWDSVMSNLTFFGHSMLRVDYHNLFMTTLHQIGVLGTLLFFAVLCLPVVMVGKSFFSKSGPDPDPSWKSLQFACLSFMILFLINETKVEFTRAASYDQVCWTMFALCYLVSRSGLTKQEAEYERV